MLLFMGFYQCTSWQTLQVHWEEAAIKPLLKHKAAVPGTLVLLGPDRGEKRTSKGATQRTAACFDIQQYDGEILHVNWTPKGMGELGCWRSEAIHMHKGDRKIPCPNLISMHRGRNEHINTHQLLKQPALVVWPAWPLTVTLIREGQGQRLLCTCLKAKHVVQLAMSESSKT